MPSTVKVTKKYSDLRSNITKMSSPNPNFQKGREARAREAGKPVPVLLTNLLYLRGSE